MWRRCRRVAAAFVLAGVVALACGGSARADDATDQARKRYETGLELFYARQHAQALVEFQQAHEIKPRPATLFMMAQCEYLLGELPTAREHYEAYLRESPAGEFVEVAKDRIESINRRPATLVINCVPDNVGVRVTPEGGPGTSVASDLPIAPGALSTIPRPLPTISGQAPNSFSVPRGRWRVTVSKPNYRTQSLVVDLEVADTKSLFFQLDPIPARLEIETIPPGATLFVNGNRARNPYRQDVSPGPYEIFGEATDYDNRTDTVILGPGEKRIFGGAYPPFRLRYIQRSGRPELLVASGLMGAFVGAGAVVASLNRSISTPNVSSVSFTLSGAFVGAIAGALVANNAWPAYIPDNRALFTIGAMWIGAAEGALTGIIIFEANESREAAQVQTDYPALREFKPPPYLATAAFIGSVPGLALGITAGALLNYKAPTYGRVALIQSAAAGGALVGALTAVAFQQSWFGFKRGVAPLTDSQGMFHEAHLDKVVDLSIPSLIGLNVGLGAGLLGAYLPDQSLYGPTWKRLALIDLAAGAGALAGGIAACVAQDQCVGPLSAESGPRAQAAAFALLGGGLGLAAGILLTRNVDRNAPGEKHSEISPPMLTLLPARAPDGGVSPLFGAVGAF